MSIQLLFSRENSQRAIVLATESHALTFRHSNSNSSTATELGTPTSPYRCMVELSSLNAINLEDFRTLPASKIHGTLGLINIKTDVYLCVISKAVRVATVRPGETVQQILSVEFCEFCTTSTD